MRAEALQRAKLIFGEPDELLATFDRECIAALVKAQDKMIMGERDDTVTRR